MRWNGRQRSKNVIDLSTKDGKRLHDTHLRAHDTIYDNPAVLSRERARDMRGDWMDDFSNSERVKSWSKDVKRTAEPRLRDSPQRLSQKKARAKGKK